MSDLKISYGPSGQPITLSVASLANNAARASTAIDNSVDQFIEALTFFKIKAPASSTSSTGYVNIFTYGSVNSAIYTEGASGVDANITLTSPTNARLLGTMNIVGNGVTYYGGPFPVSSTFGGVLPPKWGVIIENKTGGTLDTSGNNHSVFYQGVNLTVV